MTAVLRITVMALVTSLCLADTLEDAVQQGFGRLGCTVTNPRIDNIYLSNSDTVYGEVKNLISQIEAKVAEQGLIEVSDDDSALRDCVGVTDSGVFNIKPIESRKSFPVFCDMETENGNWTVIQRRKDGSSGFNRGWKDYRSGFGSRNGEYWLGNENLFWLTAQDIYQLRIDMTDFQGQARYVVYDHFRVGDEGSRFKLLLGPMIEGDAGDSLSSHNNAPFTTPDYDNDGSSVGNCAAYFEAGWWFTNCYHANLNGVYRDNGEEIDVKGVVWSEWRGLNISLASTEMKIRPRGY